MAIGTDDQPGISVSPLSARTQPLPFKLQEAGHAAESGMPGRYPLIPGHHSNKTMTSQIPSPSTGNSEQKGEEQG